MPPKLSQLLEGTVLELKIMNQSTAMKFHYELNSYELHFDFYYKIKSSSSTVALLMTKIFIH